MKKIIFCCLSFLLSVTATTAFAGDVALGESKATACIACHGEQGNKPIAFYPKLAGQAEKYLVHALSSYQDGTRNNAIMVGQAAALTKEDIADLAAYFAAQDGDLF
ncbi:MAG: cytochrome c [Proteobacteria bacterium]|nr:cytochrome c [Pseudomonadota bacterium]